MFALRLVLLRSARSWQRDVAMLGLLMEMMLHSGEYKLHIRIEGLGELLCIMLGFSSGTWRLVEKRWRKIFVQEAWRLRHAIMSRPIKTIAPGVFDIRTLGFMSIGVKRFFAMQPCMEIKYTLSIQ